MRLTVLVPSEDYKIFAGSRIRYGRIGPELSVHGIELRLENIATFQPSTAASDVVLISKCNDAQSLVAAAVMRDRGALVGVDLFDDYFSDSTDGRLLRYRNWLSQMLELCDFVLCSTEVMACVVRKFASALPVHIMNDPGPPVDERSLAAMLAEKICKARDERLLRICWFGVGDNAYFPVGLADLSASAGQLAVLRRSGMDVQLTVLTNRRALNADGLSLIEQIPVPTEVSEWNEAAEQKLLAKSLLAFLPVSAQPFSKAKSLNRAVTALSSGCQVLSSAYPLYEELSAFIYRDGKSFLDDLARGTLRLSPDSLCNFKETLERVSDPAAEARKLSDFLSSLPAVQIRPLAVVLVHGFATRSEADSMAKRVRGLSVASPYCTAPLDFDVVFRGRLPNTQMLVSRDAAIRLVPRARRLLKGREKIRGRDFFRIHGAPGGRPANTGFEVDQIPLALATYSTTMGEIERRMVQAFGPCRTIVSETSSLPFLARAEMT